MKDVDKYKSLEEYKIKYPQQRYNRSAWIQGSARVLDAIMDDPFPEWHIMGNPKGRVDNPSTESLIVYQDTMHSAMWNRKRLVEEGQKARRPHPPVLPTNYSYLFYDRLGKLAPLPKVIYPHVCWWVYGKIENLATFNPVWACEYSFTKQLTMVSGVAGLKLAEYNPEVSFSYAYGNNMYTIKRAGYISSTYLPSKAEYIAGLDDASDIIHEMEEDNVDGDVLPTYYHILHP